MVCGLRGTLEIIDFYLEVLEVFFLTLAERALGGSILRLAFLIKSVSFRLRCSDLWVPYRCWLRRQGLSPWLLIYLVLMLMSFATTVFPLSFIRALSLISMVTFGSSCIGGCSG